MHRLLEGGVFLFGNRYLFAIRESNIESFDTHDVFRIDKMTPMTTDKEIRVFPFKFDRCCLYMVFGIIGVNYRTPSVVSAFDP